MSHGPWIKLVQKFIRSSVIPSPIIHILIITLTYSIIPCHNSSYKLNSVHGHETYLSKTKMRFNRVQELGIENVQRECWGVKHEKKRINATNTLERGQSTFTSYVGRISLCSDQTILSFSSASFPS